MKARFTSKLVLEVFRYGRLRTFNYFSQFKYGALNLLMESYSSKPFRSFVKSRFQPIFFSLIQYGIFCSDLLQNSFLQVFGMVYY